MSSEDWRTEETWRRWLMQQWELTQEANLKQEVHAIAQVTFLRTEDGGRQSPVTSEYRGQFFYDGGDWDAHWTFADEPVQPGQTVEAIIEFMSPAAHQAKLHSGKAIKIREGNRTVAEGALTWVWEPLNNQDR